MSGEGIPGDRITTKHERYFDDQVWIRVYIHGEKIELFDTDYNGTILERSVTP